MNLRPLVASLGRTHRKEQGGGRGLDFDGDLGEEAESASSRIQQRQDHRNATKPTFTEVKTLKPNMEKEICNKEMTQRVCKGSGRTKEGPREPGEVPGKSGIGRGVRLTCSVAQ
jgi:hypothetical protein